MDCAVTPQWKTTLKKALAIAGLFAVLFLVTIGAYFWLKPYINFHRNGMVAQSVMVLASILICVIIAYLGMTKRLTLRIFLILLLALGFVLRLGYVLYTAGSARQHDTFSKNYDGHEAYAWILFTTGKLPTSNVYQFYHPPLNAMVQAVFMHFIEGLTQMLTKWFSLGDYFPTKFLYGKPNYMDDTRYFLFSSCQILGVMYAFITAYFGVKIVCAFRFSDKTKGLLSAFVVLFPRGIQMSGMLNNDALAYMFAIVAVYFALKWYKNQAFGWIIACAFAVGLGLMTKLSSATVCLAIAGIFAYQFFRISAQKESKKLGNILFQFAVFLVICAPIGLWFQVYAKIRFGQEFGYVFSNLHSGLSTADRTFFERFFITFDSSEYFVSLFCRPFDNYNLLNYVVRNSIFGEFSYWQGEGFGAGAVALAFLGLALLFVSELVCLFHRIKNIRKPLQEGAGTQVKRTWQEIGFVALFTISQIGAYVYFNIQMPYGCTMDYRYILPMSLVLALTLGMVKEGLEANGDKFSMFLSRSLTIVSVGFLISSALFYCTCI